MRKFKCISIFLFIIGFQFTYSQTELNSELLESEVIQNDIIIVQYYDKDCLACQQAKPIYVDFAEKYKGQVSFYKLDINKSNQDFGVEVTPTYRIIAGGGVLETVKGNYSISYLDYILGETVIEKQKNGFKNTNPNSKLKNLLLLNKKLASNKKLLLKVNGGFEDPGPPDEFQVYEFCEQIREDKSVFTYEAQKVFIKYLSTKVLGIYSDYGDKKIKDEPYQTYLKKYLPNLICDTQELYSSSMREQNSFYKHVIDLGRTDYFNKYFFGVCVSNNFEKGINVNQIEIINGQKETLLDFLDRVIDFRNKSPTGFEESMKNLRKLRRELVEYCGAKKGSELE